MLFERVLDAVVVAHLASGRIVLWNGAAEKLFGYTAQQAVGQSIEILMPGPIAHVHRAGLARYLRTGHGLIIDADGPVEMPARRRSGEEIRIELTLSELVGASGERYAVAAMRDASQRTHLNLARLELAQAQLARSEAEAELAARDEFIATLASNLRGDPLPEELQHVVRTLTDFQSLHGGEMRMAMIETDLVDMAHSAVDEICRRAPERRLVIHTPPRAAAICDPERMAQVFDQVLDEATRRTRVGARIEVRIDLVSPQLVQVTVRSQPCGDTSAAGPGLHLSRSLVRRQGGTFSTAISPGGGLEVVLTLPASPHPPRHGAVRPRRPRRAAISG